MDKGKPTDGESEEEIDILLKGTSRSFYLSLKVLPKKIRKQIGLGYILPRLSDTIADSKVGDNKILLKLLKQYNQRIQDKNSPLPDFSDLAAIQEDAAEARLLNDAVIPINYLEESETLTESDRKEIRKLLDIIISGQILDLERFTDASGDRIVALTDDNELDDYTYRVAGSVGEFWTHMSLNHLLSITDDKENILFERAVNFGKSLQLINILRDLFKEHCLKLNLLQVFHSMFCKNVARLVVAMGCHTWICSLAMAKRVIFLQNILHAFLFIRTLFIRTSASDLAKK